MIELKKLTKGFRDGHGDNRLFTDISLNIEEGEFVAFTGVSGCGKTTLLNMIGSLDEPDEGEVWVNNVLLNSLTASRRARFLNENIGFIFQWHYLLPEQTALANVMLPLRIGGHSKRKARERALELLEKLDLQERLDAYPTTLSGGECQRVAIARALANRPKVLLADEPTASLNPELKLRVLEDLLRLSREDKTTVLMATHEHKLIEPKPGHLMIDRNINVEELTTGSQR